MGLFALCVAPGLARAQTYVQSATPYNAISTTGHTVLSSWASGFGCPDTVGDDSLSALLNIGFSFRFGSSSYTQLRVHSNGRLQFGNTYCYFGTQAVGPPRTFPDPMPSANLNNTMRIYGGDFDDSSAGGGTITQATVGTAPNRAFVVTWNAVPAWSATGTVYRLQIQLQENGEFLYMYGVSNNVTSPGGVSLGPAQVGWQLGTSDFAVVRSGLPPNNTGMRFQQRPALTLAKSSTVLSDPQNGTTNPKRIPGAIVRYDVRVTNTGAGTVDSSTLVITDPVPANTDLHVGPASGPAVTFVDGSTPSGLSFALPANLSYSNQPGGGPPFSYTPAPDAAGFDAAVTGVRIAPTGTMNGTTSATSPSFTVQFRVRVR